MSFPVTGQVNNTWITNLSMTKPAIREKYFKQYRDQFSAFFDFVQQYSESELISSETYGHFEEGKIWTKDTVFANGTIGTANTAKVVQISPITTAGVSTYVFMQENDIVEMEDAANSTTVFAVVQELAWNTDHYDATLIPLVLGEAIPAITAGKLIINHGNSWGEGTGQPSGQKTPYDYEEGYLQIIKTSFEMTGSAKTEQEWITYQEGGGNFTFHKEQMDAEMRHKRRIGQAFLTGQVITNAAAKVDKNGKARQNTEGALKFAATRGNVTSKAINAFDLAAFDSIENYSVSVRSDGVQLMLNPLARQQELNRLLKTQFGDNNINVLDKYLNKELKGFPEQSLAATMNYKLYTGSRNSYVLSSLDALNDPETFNAAGFGSKYQATSLIMPFGSTKDPVNKKMIPHFGVVYKGFKGYNRLLEVWDEGTARPTNRIGDLDIDKLNMRSHVGTRFAMGKQWQLVTG